MTPAHTHRRSSGLHGGWCPFIRDLNAGGETQPGVRYTVIVSTTDFLVTPTSTSFLSGSNVRNITIQDEHPGAVIGHIGLAYDPISLGYISDALSG